MIKEITKLMNEYGTAYEQINSVYEQAKAYCDKNYVPSSEMYKNTLGTSYDTRTKALKPIFDKTSNGIKECLDNARKQVKKAIMTQPTEEQMKLIQMVQEGTFTDTEKEMFLDSVKGNYLADKMMHQAMGIDFSSHTVENILDTLDKVEDMTLQSYSYDGTPKKSYNSKILMRSNGYLEQVSNSINEFITAYSGQEEGV